MANIKIYKIAELLSAAKAVIRGSITGVSTEAGADLDLVVNAAARLFQGTQVAAAVIDQNLDPQRADAQRRDDLVDQLGLVFAKDATPARGLLAAMFNPEITVGDFDLPVGTEIVFPGTLFADGVERTYRLLQNLRYGGYIAPDSQLLAGSGIRKLLPAGPDGSTKIHDRSLLRIKLNSGATTYYAVARTSNRPDQSIDLFNQLPQGPVLAGADRLYKYTDGCVVEVECVTAGKVGNAPPVLYTATADDDITALTGSPAQFMLVETGGGGDAVGDIDNDVSRVVRLIEDTIAMPPGFGNAQQWREIALACPNVDLDDAVVFQGVRGPGTIDIVCIGRSGGLRSSAWPDANLSFVGWGNNTRRIGEAQAEVVQAWCQSKAGYFDDIVCRSVEWDWRGNTYLDTTFTSFVQAASGVVVSVEHQDGYGPDCGVALDVLPNSASPYVLLPPVGSGSTIDPSLQPGHRVWVTVGYATADARHSFTTIVTEVLTVAPTRLFATIADISTVGPGAAALDGAQLAILRWGSAGPLTQPVLDAVFAYYDQLGPGSYTEPSFGPYYVRHFHAGPEPVVPGVGLTRWPAEGRRWSSSLRASELRAAIMSIAGVHAATVTPVGDDEDDGLLDFDPCVFKTLACNGVVPRYG